jgi:toxin CcdB
LRIWSASITSATTMQFDVFPNPLAALRRTYPFVVVLQSDFAESTSERLVAPIVPRKSLAKITGRLMPIVEIDSIEHVVLVPALTGVPRADLRDPLSSLATYRSNLLDAIDYLFFGI